MTSRSRPPGRFNIQCGSAVQIDGSSQEGDRQSLQFGPLQSQALRFRFEFVLPVRVGQLVARLCARVNGETGWVGDQGFGDGVT